MRTPVQLLLVLTACSIACWLFSLYTRSVPPLISGEVIDWNTGKPAPFAEVRMDQLNFTQPGARTDAHGHFSFLPAIPATLISGHVYGNDGNPIAGCHVSAVTRASRHSDFSVDLQMQGAYSLMTYDRMEADDSNKFLDVEDQKTDANGAYAFQNLGSDRYVVLTRCQVSPTQTEDRQFAWKPARYPQQITLFPGDHRTGIDFHLHRERTYRFEGKIVLSDQPPQQSRPRAVQLTDLIVIRSDRALTSTWLGQEPCRITPYTGSFRCDSLPPGAYTFYFEVKGPQVDKVQHEVRASDRQSVIFQLHNRSDAGSTSLTPFKGPGGNLDFARVCAQAADAYRPIQIFAWGHGHARSAGFFVPHPGEARLHLPEDQYTLNAFEAAFIVKDRNYLGHSSKFEAVLMQQGTRISLTVGQTSEPPLQVLTTRELINRALTSLRISEPRFDSAPLSPPR